MGSGAISARACRRLRAVAVTAALALWLVAAPGAVAADTTPPDTTILTGPNGLTNDPSPTFTFVADEPAGFLCATLFTIYAPCESPYTPGPLPDGENALFVYGVDGAGNSELVGGSPASRSFTVDHTKPAIRFAAKPDRVTIARRARFKPRADEPVVPGSMRCRLDAGVRRACSRVIRYRRLEPGRHVIRVVASDAAGNVGRRTWSWRVVAP